MPVDLTYEDRLRRSLEELEAEREALRKKATMVDLLEITAIASAAATAVQSLLHFILERICIRLGWQVGRVLFPSDDGSMELRPSGIVFCEDEDRFSPFLHASATRVFVHGEDLPGRVWKQSQIEWMEDLANSPDFRRLHAASTCGLVSGLAWPVLSGRKTIAVVEMFSDRLQLVDVTLGRTLMKVGSQFGRAVERQRADEMLRRSLADMEKQVEGRSLDLQLSNQRLQQKIAEYARSERVKDDLVSTVSHELRTPLASLRGFTELMLSRQFPVERQEQFLEIIHKESIRLTKLINDFLDVQRLESGKVNFHPEVVSIEPLLEDAMTLFNTGNALGRIHISIEEDLPKVMIDADRIRQVLANLINNAVKFSPNGGEICVGAVRDANWVTVFVSDHGIGMEDEVIGRLFEKFFRADSADTRSIGGTGLGLALVKQIVEAHKGLAWAESNPGEGTVVFVNLPVADEMKHRNEGRRVGLIDVLLVEDDAAYAQLLMHHLEEAGLTALGTNSAEEALSWLRNTQTRLVLLDTHLSGDMDGWDVANSMKLDPFLRFIPIVNISASETRSGGMLLDGCVVLPLPTSLDEFEAALHRSLGPRLSGKVLLGVTEEFTLGQVAEWLERCSHLEMQQADSVEEILERLGQEIPTLLVMELQLGDKGAVQVVNALRGNRRAVNLPVVVLANREIQPNEQVCLARRLVHLMRKDQHEPAEIVEKALILLNRTTKVVQAKRTGQSDLLCVADG